MILLCDEDDSIYLSPHSIRSQPPITPSRMSTIDGSLRYDAAGGIDLAGWRPATDEEIAAAGWAPYIAVYLRVDVTGPPELSRLRGGSLVAATTEAGVQGDAITAYSTLAPTFAGLRVRQVTMSPANGGQFAGISKSIPVTGWLRDDTNGQRHFTGTVTRLR
jgi:hypothetical protein